MDYISLLRAALFGIFVGIAAGAAMGSLAIAFEYFFEDGELRWMLIPYNVALWIPFGCYWSFKGYLDEMLRWEETIFVTFEPQFIEVLFLKVPNATTIILTLFVIGACVSFLVSFGFWGAVAFQVLLIIAPVLVLIALVFDLKRHFFQTKGIIHACFSHR